VRIWNTRSLVLNGLANRRALDAALTAWRGRPVESVPVGRDLNFDPKSSQSVVAIWAPDYEGCSIGPIKVVCAAAWIKPWDPDQPESYRFMWWHYYGNSPTNSEFKATVWGIKNELAAVETSYQGSWKCARYLQNGRPALTMAWDASRAGDYEEGPVEGYTPARFLSVSQRPHDDGENEVWLRIRRLTNVQGKTFPFDAHRDVFEVDPKAPFGKALGDVSFLPIAWEYLTSYSGIVWITRPDGRGSAPPWPDAPAGPGKRAVAGRKAGGHPRPPRHRVKR
jgi:hypothetical protein